MQLIDFDAVEDCNVTTQGYDFEDIGQLKVDATAGAVQRVDPMTAVEVVVDRYRSKHRIGEAVFCCVDSISTREAIWRTASRKSRFWSDGRMLGEFTRVLAAADTDSRRYYPTTLFQQSDAQTGRCTARGVIYAACIAAGLMIHQFVRWMREQPVEADVSLNLAAMELVVAGSG